MWGEDEAGPFQTIPYPGQQWCPAGHPARYPHEHVRNGTAKLLTLFHPASGAVRVKGVTSCHNAVLHGWLQTELTTILATLPTPPVPVSAQENRANWERWQEGLAERLTLRAELPPLRMLLVLDNLAGHKTAELRVLAVRPRHHAALHPPGRLLAQHDRVGAAHPQATRARRAASDNGGRDHRRSGSRRAGMERGANTLRLGRATVRPPPTQSPTTPCPGRFRRLYAPAASAPAFDCPSTMAISKANDPLVVLSATYGPRMSPSKAACCPEFRGNFLSGAAQLEASLSFCSSWWAALQRRSAMDIPLEEGIALVFR